MRSSRSGTATFALRRAPGRTGHGPSRHAAVSPAPGPMPRETSRASGSRSPAAHPGTARDPLSHHALPPRLPVAGFDGPEPPSGAGREQSGLLSGSPVFRPVTPVFREGSPFGDD